MAKHPNLDELNDLFDKGKDFRLTDKQYETKTGTMLPKDKYYLVNKSALARKAKEQGYVLNVMEKTVVFTKKEAASN